jgi:3-phosphoshikimate 1-carboxyvinyltransferase
MATKIFPPTKWQQNVIDLPTSKSISNRLLIIQYLCIEPFDIEYLSESDDTQVLAQALANIENTTIDVGHAGTAMRFLTALLSVTPGTHLLTGSARMQKRPLGPLVLALQALGATIHFENQTGFPPLRIEGKPLIGGRVKMPANVSSQFLSALMLVGPTMSEGLIIELTGDLTSQDYLKMTAELMRQHGVQVQFSNSLIRVAPGAYQPKSQRVEADWSAASYWYQMVALGKTEGLTLTGLYERSLQGDRKVATLFEGLGVSSFFSAEGVRLKKVAKSAMGEFRYDYSHQPDLAQTFAVTLCALGIPYILSGLHTLYIKETDRIQALVSELMKFGYALEDEIPGTLSWDGRQFEVTQQEVFVATYEDHRMAMAFAPLSLIYPGLVIMSPGVVSKSYPHFWDDLFKVGFRLKRI